ncbi:protein PSY3 [Actinidia eriantha]|uniref:protein PSY3 n=1 Tax=Actinidia eriantha TaxID=165200 RepID=UPI00258FBC68|nr:protein PSY3 [Actinidia eriantha]
MGDGLRLWLCFIFCLAIYCSVRNTISLSDNQISVISEAQEGRSLRVKLNDYSEASANHGHDPSRTKTGGTGSTGGRKAP